MPSAPTRGTARQKRHARIRLTVRGTAARPRLAVFRSLDQIYAQVIDDRRAGHGRQRLHPREGAARRVRRQDRDGQGRRPPDRRAGQGAGVKQVVFDRAGYRYHGRDQSLADAAREAGLEF